MFKSIAEPTILLDQDDEPSHVNPDRGQFLLGEDTPGASQTGHPDTARLRLLVTEILSLAGRDDTRGDQIALDTAIGLRTVSIAIQDMLYISRRFAGRVVILKAVTGYLAAVAAAEEANRAKSTFLVTVSHETKTPINSIIGRAELLDDGSLALEYRRQIDAIRTAGRLLSELVENILGLSRSGASAVQRNEQDFDLCQLIEGIVEMVRTDADARGLTAAVDCAPELPRRVQGDARQLRHALFNLLSNASKFTSKGGVTLRVGLQAAAGPARPETRFAVEDTGVDLPMGPNAWLFDPFTQYVHSEFERCPRGTGLGLAICKGLVTFRCRVISATPVREGGSVFAFDLPFSAVDVAPEPAVAYRALDVLVGEDDPVNALVAEGSAADLGPAAVVVHDYWAPSMRCAPGGSTVRPAEPGPRDPFGARGGRDTPRDSP